MNQNKIFEILSEEQFDKILTIKRLILIDFNAKWCQPCNRIKPFFKNLAENYPSVAFLSINVDHHPNISERFQVTALPTFIFVGKNKILHKVLGSDIEQVEEVLKKFTSRG